MKYDVIVIGGGAGGFTTAVAVKTFYPDKKVLLIRRTKKMPIPCAVPYLVSTVPDLDKNVIPDEPLKKSGVELLIDEVIEIDREKKKVITKGGKEFEYEKLVIATGALPIKLKIPGIDLDGVVLVYKEYEPLEEFTKKVKDVKKVVIIGAGFVGVEFADDFIKAGKDVTIVEIKDNVLPLAFDKEFGMIAKEELEKRGVKLLLGRSVKEIKGNGKVEKVVLDDGTELEADLVLVSVGVKPNSEIAQKAGIKVDERGFIEVDAFMRTSDPDVYAVGDVVIKKSFFTGKKIKAFFSSIAVIEARVAALNMFSKVSTVNASEGWVVSYSTVVGNTAFAAAGLTLELAKMEGFDVYVVDLETVNRHPGVLPGGRKIKVRMLFTKRDLRFVGIQLAGPECVGEIINYATAAIQNKYTAYDLLKLQMSTQPMLTASPVAYPLQMGALKAIAMPLKS